jgi:hypothetical protein
MTCDPGERLTAAGLDVPRLEPLPLAAGVWAAGFSAEGDAALDWWRRLRAAHERTGLWPVLTPSVAEAVDPTGDTEIDPAQRVARSAALDGAALLSARGVTFDALDEHDRQELLERWSEAEPRRLDGFDTFARHSAAEGVSRSVPRRSTLRRSELRSAG